jgi:hypothetical protein
MAKLRRIRWAGHAGRTWGKFETFLEEARPEEKTQVSMGDNMERILKK